MSVKLSTKCRYGARAISEIALGWPQIFVKKRHISETQSIPASYLENILLELKDAGLIEATRGANGGYRLTRPPEEITMLEILQAFGDYFDPVDCISDPDSCPRSPRCATRRVWVKLHKAQEQALSIISVKDLLEEEAML